LRPGPAGGCRGHARLRAPGHASANGAPGAGRGPTGRPHERELRPAAHDLRPARLAGADDRGGARLWGQREVRGLRGCDHRDLQGRDDVRAAGDAPDRDRESRRPAARSGVREMRVKSGRAAVLVVLMTLASIPIQAAPSPSPSVGWITLFNGTDLSGWDTWLGIPHAS